jgi:hypothetical protein
MTSTSITNYIGPQGPTLWWAHVEVWSACIILIKSQNIILPITLEMLPTLQLFYAATNHEIANFQMHKTILNVSNVALWVGERMQVI